MADCVVGGGGWRSPTGGDPHGGGSAARRLSNAYVNAVTAIG
jgi:hypothetical protein